MQDAIHDGEHGPATSSGPTVVTMSSQQYDQAIRDAELHGGVRALRGAARSINPTLPTTYREALDRLADELASGKRELPTPEALTGAPIRPGTSHHEREGRHE